MKIAVLSGKGGAGKTFTAVNLIHAAGRGTYIDCDVEEPNGRLFLKPRDPEYRTVSTLLPEFDREKCTGCRKCVDFCRFNALLYIKSTPMVFKEVCHSCGGCRMVCPEAAIREVPRPVGQLEIGRSGNIRVITGILNPGEASGIPIIRSALKAGADSLTVIDCPPGSACGVMESLSGADRCILVAEPTSFGFDNFKMVWELAALLGKPCGVVINKYDSPYAPLEQFCQEHSLPILARIPFRREIAAQIAAGSLPPECRELFRQLLERIGVRL